MGVFRREGHYKWREQQAPKLRCKVRSGGFKCSVRLEKGLWRIAARRGGGSYGLARVCPVKELFHVISGELLKDFEQGSDQERFGLRNDHSGVGWEGLVAGGWDRQQADQVRATVAWPKFESRQCQQTWRIRTWVKWFWGYRINRTEWWSNQEELE